MMLVERLLEHVQQIQRIVWILTDVKKKQDLKQTDKYKLENEIIPALEQSLKRLKEWIAGD